MADAPDYEGASADASGIDKETFRRAIPSVPVKDKVQMRAGTEARIAF